MSGLLLLIDHALGEQDTKVLTSPVTSGQAPPSSIQQLNGPYRQEMQTRSKNIEAGSQHKNSMPSPKTKHEDEQVGEGGEMPPMKPPKRATVPLNSKRLWQVVESFEDMPLKVKVSTNHPPSMSWEEIIQTNVSLVNPSKSSAIFSLPEHQSPGSLQVGEGGLMPKK